MHQGNGIGSAGDGGDDALGIPQMKKKMPWISVQGRIGRRQRSGHGAGARLQTVSCT
jgi:hypothetical protein